LPENRLTGVGSKEKRQRRANAIDSKDLIKEINDHTASKKLKHEYKFDVLSVFQGHRRQI